MRARVGILSVLVATAIARAEALPPAIGERALIARVERASPRAIVAATRLGEAEAEVAAARVRANPSISYQREEIYAAGTSFPENYLTVGVPLELSGRRGLAIEAAEAGVAARRAEIAVARLEIVLDAVAAARRVAHLRARREILVAGRAALGAIDESVRRRVAAGDAAGYDGRRLAIELAAHDDLIAGADADLAAARRRLALLAGGPEPELDAADPLVLPQTSGADAATSALATRPDYQASLERRRQAERALAAARRGWIPAITLTGGLKTSDLGTEVATGFVAAVQLTLPLFDRGQADGAQARAARRAADADARRLEAEIPAVVRAALDDVARRSARARAFADAQLTELDALVRAAEAAYREGERPVFELLDAHRTAREVRLHELDLRLEASLAELELWRATGRHP